MVDLTQSDSESPIDVASMLAEALDSHQQNHLTQAEALYQMVLLINPADFVANHQLGVLKNQYGDFEAAEKFLNEAVRLRPKSPLARLNLGIALWNLDKADEALMNYEYSLLIQPDNPETLWNCAVALRMLQRPEEALVRLEQLLWLDNLHLEAFLHRGLLLEELDRTEEALSSYEQVLLLQPDHADALVNRGNALLDLGRSEEALESYDRALAVRANDADTHNNRSNALRSLNRPFETLDSCDRALVLRPNHANALLNRGNILLTLDRPEEALESYDQLLSIEPDLLDALSNRCIALRKLNRPLDALNSCERALTIDPNHWEALINRGGILLDLKRPLEALANCDRVSALRPEDAETFLHRGDVLYELHRPLEALAHYDLALALQPNKAGLHANRGNILVQLGRSEEALACYDRALALHPQYVDVLSNRSAAFINLKRPAEALETCRQALTYQPDNLIALVNQATALLELKRPQEALEFYDRVVAIAPEYAEAYSNRGMALHLLGFHKEAVISYEKALEINPTFASAHSNKIFLLDYIPELDFVEHQAERKNFNLAQAVRFSPPTPVFNNDRNPDRPLVVGYVSADFKYHSAAFCFAPVLKNHDKAKFKIICYSGVGIEDAMTERVKGYADVWRPTLGLSDEALAAQIRNDEVDILVDLSGHSENNRLLVFARKPAPVQVTAWGHAGGTGLSTMDYQFTDPVFTPEEARPLFAETSYDLPCCITFENPGLGQDVTELPAVSRGFVTFGSLNRFSKVTQDVLELWARILQAVPTSRLILKDAIFDDPIARKAILSPFLKQGIDLNRIETRGFSSRQKHLLAYYDVDIALDSFPQNGGITTWEALWMGAPVVALVGNRPSSRLSAAILTTLGLGDWVCGDETEYLELAVGKASDLAALAEFRRGIRKRIEVSPAGNPALYTRAVEEGYRSMWKQWLAQ